MHCIHVEGLTISPSGTLLRKSRLPSVARVRNAPVVECRSDCRERDRALASDCSDHRKQTSGVLVGSSGQRRSARVARFADVNRIAELAAARLPDRQRRLRALGDKPPFLLRQGGVEVQHEWIGVAAKFGHDEGDALRPATNATSRDSRSSFDTRTLHFAVRAAARAAAS